MHKISTNVGFDAFQTFQRPIVAQYADTILVGNSTKWFLYNAYNLDVLIFFYDNEIKHIVMEPMLPMALDVSALSEIHELIKIFIKKNIKTTILKRLILIIRNS